MPVKVKPLTRKMVNNMKRKQKAMVSNIQEKGIRFGDMKAYRRKNARTGRHYWAVHNPFSDAQRKAMLGSKKMTREMPHARDTTFQRATQLKKTGKKPKGVIRPRHGKKFSSKGRSGVSRLLFP